MDETGLASEAVRPGLPPGVDRRGFLRTSAGGAAAVALASLFPSGCASDYPQATLDGVELVALSAKEYAVMRAAAEALLVGVPVPPSRVAARVDRVLAQVGEPVRGDMKLVLGLLEHLTILEGKFRRFTALSPEARRECLLGWGRSRFALQRGAFQAVKAFVYFFAYIDDATRPLTGFPGPWPERFSIPARPVDFGEVV
ncbi:MAG TPA: twin-arginine translocation signal domain-containing protein [Longimicrobiales bacterium]